MDMQSKEYRYKVMAEKLSGEGYLFILQQIHLVLRPKKYLEIGVFRGQSLALALPETYSIGIDPNPEILFPLHAWTRIYKLTSAEFFSKYIGSPFDLIFIDGLHHYEAVVEDFINCERFCKPSTLLILHDTIPLSADTSTQVETPEFWTGDVWKIVPALLKGRQDLKVYTIACPPSGLTFIYGFSQPKGISKDIIDEFKTKDFAWLDKEWIKNLNVIVNDKRVWFHLLAGLKDFIENP